MEENRLIPNITIKPTSQIPAKTFSLNAKEGEMAPNVDEGGGRERLKRHREEVAGEVVIPDKWGKDQLLKDWVKYTAFDACFAPHRLIVTARDALIADARKAKSQRSSVHNSC